MCRMIVAPGGVPGELLLPAFRRMAQGRNDLNEVNTEPGAVSHGDGWGAVFLEQGKLARLRSLVPCWEDSELAVLEGKTVLALHARRASRGSTLDIENVHPFERETDAGAFYFGHNGTVRDPLTVGRSLAGETDSERYFVFLVEALVRAGLEERALIEAVDALQDYTALNAFLLREGCAWIIARARRPARYYTLHWASTRWGPVVASEPLADVACAWTPIESGAIMRCVGAAVPRFLRQAAV